MSRSASACPTYFSGPSQTGSIMPISGSSPAVDFARAATPDSGSP